jgi:hypothetical protein
MANNTLPLDVWAAFLCMNADGVARNFCYQAMSQLCAFSSLKNGFVK